METQTEMTVGTKKIEITFPHLKHESSNVFDRHGIDDMHIIGLAD